MDGQNFNENYTTGYLEIVPMTFDEKVKMYMKLSKLELAKMLAERDRVDMLIPPKINEPYEPYTIPPTIYPHPWSPYDPWNQPYYTTTSSGTMEGTAETLTNEDGK